MDVKAHEAAWLARIGAVTDEERKAALVLYRRTMMYAVAEYSEALKQLLAEARAGFAYYVERARRFVGR